MSSSIDQNTQASTEHSVQLGLAALVSVAITVVLAALAFWPARVWAPPPRPALNKPIVFDDFFNAPASPSSAVPSPVSSAP